VNLDIRTSSFAAQQAQIDVQSIAFCLLGNFLLRLAGNAGGAIIALYLASWRQSGVTIHAQTIGLAAVAYYVAELTTSTLFGRLSDVRGPKPVMLLGPILGSASLVSILLAPTVPLLLVSRAFGGLATASSVPATLSYVSAETGRAEQLRGRTMGLYEVASIVGIAGGFAAGGILWDRLGKAALLVAIGIYAGSALILLLVRGHVGEPASTNPTLSVGQILRSSTTLRLIPAWVAVNAVVGLWFTHLAFQMARAHDPSQLLGGGFTGHEIGLYSGGAALVVVVGVSLWTLVLGRLRATSIMGIALGGLFALVIVLTRLNHARDIATSWIWLLVALASLTLMVLSGFTPAALTYLASLAEEQPRVRGGVLGLYSVFLGVGQLIGGAAGGFFAEWRSVDGMLVLTAIFGGIAALGIISLLRWEKSPGPVVA
jgi:MFS family permease